MRATGWTVALIGIAALLPERAEAIPAFARKYQMSCTTCHAPFPRLKPYGEEFAARGFRMDEASKEPTRATLDLGDPLLRLPRDFPLAARLEGYASWKEDAVAETDAEWPWAAKVLREGRSPSGCRTTSTRSSRKANRSNSRTPGCSSTTSGVSRSTSRWGSSRSAIRCSSGSCGSSDPTTTSSRPTSDSRESI